ncbi:MAG: hypothetical protein CME06_02280 [Gemmatimonadetes bacterium]|nr:hypothetical protein [Gemmatimonadota bacterium]
MRYEIHALATIAFLAPSLEAATIRVPDDQPTIGAGLGAATDGDTVLVAHGTYEGPGNRELRFGAKQVVLRSEWGAEYTVIDGQDRDDEKIFVFDEDVTSETIVEGFTIRNGAYAGGGCAMDLNFASPNIVDCVFESNEPQGIGAGGGGALSVWGGSEPVFLRCRFLDNTAYTAGAVYCAHAARPRFVGCYFEGNSAGGTGGAICSSGSSVPKLLDCLFVENSAAHRGGAVYAYESDIEIVNCTFVDHQAEDGTVLWSTLSDPLVSGSILTGSSEPVFAIFGAPAVSYSDVEGGYSGQGNIDADPLFEDPAGDNYRLSADSPCIDAARPGESDACLPPGLGSSLADIGAYGGEYNCLWLADCDIQLELSNLPTSVSPGETIAITASATNGCEGRSYFDEAIAELTDPGAASISLYEGSPIYLGPGGEMQAQIELTVPLGAPAGIYQAMIVILREGEPIDAVRFTVEVS